MGVRKEEILIIASFLLLLAWRSTVKHIEEGKVINTTDYGVFVKLTSGRKGLVHVNEMTKSQKNKFKKLYQPKQIVQVRVLETLAKNRLKLSFKLEDTPPKPKKDKPSKQQPTPVVPDINADEITPIQRQLQKLTRMKTQRPAKKIKKVQAAQQRKAPEKQLALSGKEFAQQLSRFLTESAYKLEQLSQQQE